MHNAVFLSVSYWIGCPIAGVLVFGRRLLASPRQRARPSSLGRKAFPPADSSAGGVDIPGSPAANRDSIHPRVKQAEQRSMNGVEKALPLTCFAVYNGTNVRVTVSQFRRVLRWQMSSKATRKRRAPSVARLAETLSRGRGIRLSAARTTKHCGRRGNRRNSYRCRTQRIMSQAHSHLVRHSPRRPL